MDHRTFGYFAPFVDHADALLDNRLDFLSLIYQLCDNVSVIKNGTSRFYFKDYRRILVLEEYSKSHSIPFAFHVLVEGGFEVFLSLNDYFKHMNYLCNSRGLRKSAKN